MQSTFRLKPEATSAFLWSAVDLPAEAGSHKRPDIVASALSAKPSADGRSFSGGVSGGSLK
jgi:hypothetical protein